MKRLILSAHVSTKEQAKLYSLDYQLEKGRAYAASIGAEVVAEFKDDMTGTTLQREGLQEALRMLEANQADGIAKWAVPVVPVVPSL